VPTIIGSTAIVVTNTGSNGAPSVSTVTIGLVANTSPPPESSSPPSQSGSTLSPGAIAGIAIGAAVGAVLVCVGLFLVHRRKRKAAQTGATGSVPEATATGPPMAGAGATANTTVTKSPVDSSTQELDSLKSNQGWQTGTVSPMTNPLTAPPSTIGSTSPQPPYSGAWHQTAHAVAAGHPQPPHGSGQQAQWAHPPGAPPNFYEVQGEHEAPNPNAQEVHGASAAMEMTGDTHLRQEMPGHVPTVYEMPSTRYSR
jgi:hypothetical protein